MCLAHGVVDKYTIFPQQLPLVAWGSLAQNTFGAIRCSVNARFRARFWKVPEGFGGFRRVPLQMLGKVAEGSGAEVR